MWYSLFAYLFHTTAFVTRAFLTGLPARGWSPGVARVGTRLSACLVRGPVGSLAPHRPGEH